MDCKQMLKIMALKSSVPEGQIGEWKVEKFVVTQKGADFHNLREAIKGRIRSIVPGTYTRLKRGKDIIMSDTPAEKEDVRIFLRHAEGEVLINGLGLGWTVEACLNIPEVKHITVVEISEKVIQLVGSYLVKKYGSEKLHIVYDDALKHLGPKGKTFDVVWHDIWDTICGDNWEDMKTLHRKYGKRCDWQGSWCREEVKRQVKECKIMMGVL